MTLETVSGDAKKAMEMTKICSFPFPKSVFDNLSERGVRVFNSYSPAFIWDVLINTNVLNDTTKAAADINKTGATRFPGDSEPPKFTFPMEEEEEEGQGNSSPTHSMYDSEEGNTSPDTGLSSSDSDMDSVYLSSNSTSPMSSPTLSMSSSSSVSSSPEESVPQAKKGWFPWWNKNGGQKRKTRKGGAHRKRRSTRRHRR